MSIYEEDASTGAASRGEPLSISIALNGSGNGDAEKEAEKVRVGLIAVDVRTGKVVHDTFEEGPGQRQELHTRLRHMRSVGAGDSVFLPLWWARGEPALYLFWKRCVVQQNESAFESIKKLHIQGM